MIHKLKDYQMAKIVVKDLEQIAKRVEASIRALEPYAKYKPVNEILYSLRSNKAILDAHYRKYKRVKDLKGGS